MNGGVRPHGSNDALHLTFHLELVEAAVKIMIGIRRNIQKEERGGGKL